MKRTITFFLATFITFFSLMAQDTFSVVAVDSITGEVGSAGASCVDLVALSYPSDDFLGELFPGVGAINSQAAYQPANQARARARMNAGDTPQEIIDYMKANDIQGNASTRQYGVVRLVNGSPQSAAHTGSECLDYKNHITGANYSIQGNILFGQEVLDSMEARFLREEGDLACKLMAALQGANMVGADSRCSSNGTSSLFAFVKVAQPDDTFGNPSFKLSVRTRNNARIEPIDSLQSLFNGAKQCATGVLERGASEKLSVTIHPNPVIDAVKIDFTANATVNYQLFSISGKKLLGGKVSSGKEINLNTFPKGCYFIEFTTDNGGRVTKKVIKQ